MSKAPDVSELSRLNAHIQTLQDAVIRALEALTAINTDPLCVEKAIVYCELALETTGLTSTDAALTVASEAQSEPRKTIPQSN